MINKAKAKPVARRGRKAVGLMSDCQVAQSDVLKHCVVHLKTS